LSNGLSRLEDAREGVKKMTADSEISRAEVTKKSAEVQSIMADAKKEQDIADDKAKFIQQESAKIEVESKIAKKLADDADHELAKAEPSLIAANDAVNSLDKKYIAEMKALNKPPEDVATVMGAVMVFMQKDTSWASVKKELSDTAFLKNILEFNKENINQKTLKRIEAYTKEPTFTPEYMTVKSAAAGALCKWVRAIEDYAKCLKVVNPKRERKALAEANLAKMQEALAKYTEEYAILEARLAELNRISSEKQAEMKALKDKLN
jgi:dynein heavy chain